MLWESVAAQKGRVAGASLLACAHQGGEALVPVVIGVLIDAAVSTGDGAALVRWLVILGVVFAVLSFSYRFAARAAEGAAEHAAHRLRSVVTQRVLDPRGGAEAGRLPGALAAVAIDDAQRVGRIGAVLPFAAAGLAGLLVSAVALLRISVPLGLLVLVGTPPLLWVAHLVGRPLERRSEVERERAAHASGVAADLVAGLRVIKGIGAETAAVARYRDTSRRSLRATLRAARAHAGHDGAILALTGLFLALVALVGAELAAAGSISVGELVAAVGLAQFLLTPFQIFAWGNGELAQARASARRVAEVLAAPPAVASGSGRPREVAGRLSLRGITHGSLRGLDLEVAPGELVGVVADPAHAADLLDCLGREVDPTSGSVLLDGTRFTELDPHELREAVLVAAHDAHLFAGTLLSNVDTRGTGDVERALRAAAADEVAWTLSRGADSLIAERGQSLSGGQRQRVALARALAADPPVLVLHDPTTAVDAVTESRIAEQLADFRRGRTTVLVTTSPALLAATDRVVVVADGAVTAEGSHAALVRSDAGYRSVVLS
ncbi:ABC transporter ATP-binding protein [Saccharopolyspora thermophila]|uniref:ABC transporter ATP-binding protein n=1 Tax=Saccharopolyspora thermophila TaxID=89367 RepID=A0ABN1SNE2_9PSEU